MKKYFAIFCMAAVLCAFSHAATTVSCAWVSPPQTLTIAYSYDGTGSFPRAFALDVTTSLGTISGVTATKVGESNSASKGFGIFPGTIVIDSAGSVTNVGSPVAPASDAGALGGIGTNGVTLELGSHYSNMAGRPDNSGVLVTVQLAGTSPGSSATVKIVPNVTRGGVVLEDGTSIGAFTSTCVYAPQPPDCFSNALSTYARWTLCGKPSCWCPPTSVTGTLAGGTGYQCAGDAALDVYPGLNYRVYTTDFNVLSMNWKRKCGDVGFNSCADLDHKPYPGLNYAVYTGDFDRLSKHWKKTSAQIDGTAYLNRVGGYGYCGQANVRTGYE